MSSLRYYTEVCVEQLQDLVCDLPLTVIVVDDGLIY